MWKFVNQLVKGKKGDGVLQAIIMLAIALFVAEIVKDQGMAAATKGGDNLKSFTAEAGQ